MPLVRNRQGGPTVIEDRKIDAVITWEGAGDPNGEDIQEVPEELLKNAGFVRAQRKGVFEIVNDIDAEVLYRKTQTDNYAARQAAEQASVDSALEASSRDNDLVPVKCLLSGEELMMREGDLRDRPPLADRFRDRADEFVSQETGEMDPTGKSKVRWVHVQIAQPTKEFGHE